MENTPSPITPAAAQPDLAELKAQCDQLQQLVSSLLLILIVVSGTLSVFLLRQYKSAKADAAALEVAAAPLIAEYNNNQKVVQDFVRKLAEYGQTHPDFSFIINKYRLNDYLPMGSMGTLSVTSSLPPAAASKK